MIRHLIFITLVALPSLATAADVIQFPQKRAERPRLKSIYSESLQLNELLDKDTRLIVFCFLDLDCPVAQQYVPRFRELHEKYQPRGVKFIGVYPNARVNVVNMAAHAHDQDIPFPVFIDIDQRLTRLVEAEVTPEVVVIDPRGDKPQWTRHYQGAIDNQFKRRGRLREVTEEYLETALDEVLDGRAVAKSHATPSGCPIEQLDPPAPRKDLTFYRDIAPLVQQNCETCHREDGVAPFELVTYDDVYYSSERIREAVEDRRMPPWHGNLNKKYGGILNDRRLSEKEIDTLVDWIRSGAAEGDPKNAPKPIQWPAADKWQIGKPDYVYKIPGFDVPKNGILDYQFFRVKMGFPAERWFRAVEVKPGDVEVVHHIGLHIVPSGDKEFTGFSGMAELYGLNSEGAILINDYVPGDVYNAKRYPPEQAVRIPANSDLVFELHYTPNNRKAVRDESKVAFQWADAAPQEEVMTKVFRKPIGRFRIPPHHAHFKMEDNYYFKHDVWLDAVRPHFHLRAKSFRLEIVQRDEDTEEITEREMLLTVPIWDPDWQRTYELEKPLLIKAGTELLATGVFDNSSLNPNNPDPTIEVQWGQQTTDEMFSTRFKYRVIKRD